MRFTVIKYHDDKDCCGDYYTVEVWCGSVKLKDYGDYYHDKGDVKAEAFCEGFAAALKEPCEIKQKNEYREYL